MEQLNELLAEIDFDQRYYRYVDSHRGAKPELTEDQIREWVARKLEGMGVSANYDKKEKFFRFEEQVENQNFIYTIALYYDRGLELIISIHTNSDKMGGTLHGLARTVALERDPTFSYSPRYPRIPFGTAAELEEAFQFSMELFRDIKQAVVGAKS